LKIHIKFF